ncbi:V-type ATPase subunit a family protein [Endozoicomonas gorgoniicola]|uniref:V-type ATPase subunit a family protein n=1 Tax=Endozoicomonas gorgoniicola TaxID=1234144 RepID=A0ABT3MVA8_9GAMM|nr:V-type ATPase subunit a family protein [Endozoicomonas gorgoniicola]MCW7553302.1 V-type ATPase subunit a family protein [Endozoicomonas gorgoniicola]
MITNEEYQALKRAVLLRDTKTIEFEGRRIEYSSFSEMERRLQAIEREISKQKKRPRQYGLYSNKGV